MVDLENLQELIPAEINSIAVHHCLLRNWLSQLQLLIYTDCLVVLVRLVSCSNGNKLKFVIGIRHIYEWPLQTN